MTCAWKWITLPGPVLRTALSSHLCVICFFVINKLCIFYQCSACFFETYLRVWCTRYSFVRLSTFVSVLQLNCALLANFRLLTISSKALTSIKFAFWLRFVFWRIRKIDQFQHLMRRLWIFKAIPGGDIESLCINVRALSKRKRVCNFFSWFL